MVNGDMFAVIIIDWISRHIYGTDVITKQLNRIINDNPKFVKGLSNPDCLSNRIAQCTLLYLDGGFGDSIATVNVLHRL